MSTRFTSYLQIQTAAVGFKRHFSQLCVERRGCAISCRKGTICTLLDAVLPVGKFHSTGPSNFNKLTVLTQAHRVMVGRLLKGLEDIIDLYQMDIAMGPQGWYFSGENGSLKEDPLHGFTTLLQLYQKADPDYAGGAGVPVLWDKKTDTLVNNDSSDILKMMYSSFDDLLPEKLREENKPGGGLFPPQLRPQIGAMTGLIESIAGGVYRVGFARSQEQYSGGIKPLFDSLDAVEEQLSHGKRYLFGDHITDSDVKLYTTIVRFDVAYHPVFLCNLKYIRYDYPNIHLWLRRLYWTQDEEGELRGAFHRATEPFIGRYGEGYSYARRRAVLGQGAPLIIPSGPKELVVKLREDEE